MQLPNTLADRFEVIRKLGESARSTTVLADDAEHGRLVLRLWPGSDSRIAPRAGAISQVMHPALPELYAFGEDTTAGITWVAQERVRGLNLAELRMALARPFTPQEAATLLTPIADALQRAHAAGITHERLSLRQITVTLAPWGVRPMLLGLAPPLSDPEPGSAVFHPPRVSGASTDVCALAALAYWLTSGSGPSGNLWNWDRPRAPELADVSWAASLGFWLAPGSGIRMDDVLETLAGYPEPKMGPIHELLELEQQARLPSQLGGTIPIKWVPGEELPELEEEEGRPEPGSGRYVFHIGLGMASGLVAMVGGLIALVSLLR